MSLATLATSVDVIERIGSAELPLLVEFGADWCPPCRTLEPILTEIAAEHADAIEIRSADVDAMPDLVLRYELASAPTMLLFVEGEPVLRMVGARPKAALLEVLAPYL